MTPDNHYLKSLAEACKDRQPLRYMRSHGALYIRNDNGIVFDVHQNRSFPDLMAQNKDYADLALACTPSTILGLLAEIAQLKDENERFRRYSEQLQADKKVLAETRVLYTWLRKKCDEPSNDVVAVYMNIGHDWAKVTDLDRDLRTMIDREEP